MRRVTVVGILVLWSTVSARSTAAQEGDSPPVPLAQLKGQTGGHHATLADRSPLSADLKAVAKRIGLVPAVPPRRPRAPAAAAPAPAGPDLTDYDVAKQSFYVYIPPAPAGDGKYGVMVGQCFKQYDAPPKAWPAVLDAHHLIWIAARDAGDDRPAAQRVGLLLDAAYNVAAVWPVDPDRVYLSMMSLMSFVGPTAGTALYYPDVFGGEVQSVAVPWYAKIRTTGKAPVVYPTDNFPPPQGKDLSLARSHSRFYLAPRNEGTNPSWDAIYKRGYK